MTIALIVVGYLGAALLCAYAEARFFGAHFTPMWLLWPVLLPACALAWSFEAVAKLGERHAQ